VDPFVLGGVAKFGGDVAHGAPCSSGSDVTGADVTGAQVTG